MKYSKLLFLSTLAVSCFTTNGTSTITAMFQPCQNPTPNSQLWNFTGSPNTAGMIQPLNQYTLCLAPSNCSSTNNNIPLVVVPCNQSTSCNNYVYDTYTYFTFTNTKSTLLITDMGQNQPATLTSSSGTPNQQFMYNPTTMTLIPADNSNLCLTMGSTSTLSVQSITVNYSEIITTSYIGLGAVRHGFDWMAEEEYHNMNDTYRNISFQRLVDSRLSGVRTWYASEWVMPNGWGTGLDFTTERFEAFANFINIMYQNNISVILNAGWWFTQCTCSPGPPSNCTPTSDSVNIYTQWISSTVKELVVNRGYTNVNTLLIFTEPFSYDSGIVPPGHTQETFYNYTIHALHQQMIQDNTRERVSFLGPNDGGLSTPAIVQALNYTVHTMNDVIDIYSSHDYDLKSYTAWYNMFLSGTSITKDTNKPFWVDEGGAGPESVRNGTDYGTYVSLWHAAAMNAGASTSWLWLFQDQYYVWPLENVTNSDSFVNGLHRWGLEFWLPDSLDVRPAYYAYTILTRFLRAPQGSTNAATVTVTGQQPDTGVISAAITGIGNRPDYRAILLVNEGNSTININVNLVDSNSNSPTYYRYIYDPANPPTNTQLVPSSGNYSGTGPITDTLPPRGVVVWATTWEQA